MFRIPKSQLRRAKTFPAPTPSPPASPADGREAGRKNQQQPGVRHPVTPFLAKTGRSPGKTRSSPLSIPSRPPSTVACGSSSSFDDDDDDDDDEDCHTVGDKNERYRSADPRLHEPHLVLDEGGGACVVVVSPRPMAAAAAAASQRQNRRHRPPTPIEGDGFPSITEEPIKARTIRPTITASSSGPFATSSFICHPAGPSAAGRGSSRRSAAAESSYDGRSSSRSSDRRPVVQEFHQAFSVLRTHGLSDEWTVENRTSESTSGAQRAASGSATKAAAPEDEGFQTASDTDVE